MIRLLLRTVKIYENAGSSDFFVGFVRAAADIRALQNRSAVL